MNKRDLLKTLLLFVVIIGLTVGAAIGLNTVTGPKIAADAAERERLENAEYLALVEKVYPTTAEFTNITKDLTLEKGVVRVFKDAAGNGYAFIATAQGYSKQVKVTVAIVDGTIAGMNVEIGSGDWAVDQSVQDSYVGQDTNLGGILTGGATYSEKAVKDAVTAGINTLINNGVIGKAKKTLELVYNDYATSLGIVKGNILEGNETITQAYYSSDKEKLVCIVKDGENKLLAIWDSNDNVKVYQANLVNEANDEYQVVEVTTDIETIVSTVRDFAANAKNGALVSVFPGAVGFKEITAELTLTAGVTNVYEETSGLGYVFVSSKKGYSLPLTVTVGVGRDGKIVGINVEAGKGDWAVDQPVQDSYIGQDSNLNGVITGGATFSEAAAKEAVQAGLTALATNGKLQAAKKTMEQAFEAELKEEFSAFVKGSDLTVSGNIYQAYQSVDEQSVVCYVNVSEEKLMAIYSSTGKLTVYKANLVNETTQEYELIDVTSANEAVADEVLAFAQTHVTSAYEDLVKRINRYADYKENDGEVQIIPNVYNSVVAALTFTKNGVTYYAFKVQTYSYENAVMSVYVILTEDGKIAKTIIGSDFLFHYDYGAPEYNKSELQNNTVGKDKDTYVPDMITGATISSDALKQAINDVFDAYASLKGGNN